MYAPYRQESQINFKIPWDTNTARGFGISLLILFLLIFLASIYKPKPALLTDFEQTSYVPVEMLNFGNGDGTGMSKGNLSEEGMMHKGKAPGNELEDASTAAKTRVVKNFSPDDPTSTSNLVPKNILPSSEKTKEQENGSGTTNTGSNLGSLTGTGLGDKGFGPGKGTGFGDIEWGGGGNRTVLQKSLPKYPQGTRYAAQIKIKFTVASDGTVTTMIPLQKGDPTLEKAAMNALRQWRFNPLAQKKDMIGIITFTFKLG